MIKLFRKIRYDLMGENKDSSSVGKAGKYLKYAVGEIILVVIGILIALQFNIWRVEKNDRKIEKVLLENIKKDLEIDSKELRNVKAFKVSQNEACLRLLEYIINDSKPLGDTIEFINDFHLITYFIIPSLNRTAYDMATNTGYLNNITSDILINDLSHYFNNIGLEQHVNDTKRFINYFSENNLIYNYPLFSKLVMPLDGQGGKYALERYKNDNRPILQLSDIRREISLENYLNELSIRLNIGIIGLEKEDEWARSLILKIENHLDSKK